jgi:hypothetical protein
MEQHEETFPNAKVLLLAAGGASLAALLIALAKRGNKEEAGERIEATAKEIEKDAKKAAKAAKKKRKKLEDEAAEAGHRLAADLRETAATVAASAEAAERDLKAAAWDAQQEAREAEGRLRAARQRVVGDASHLASRVGAEARHLAGGGKERLAHLRHRDDGESAAERELTRLRAELEELRAELARGGRRADKGARPRFPRLGDQGNTMQAVATDAGAAALEQVERALRAKAPALLTARNKAQVMEILQQDLGPTLRETAMQAATAALTSWDAARERGAATRERVRHTADDVRDQAREAADEMAGSAEHARDEAIGAAEAAVREARERAEEAEQQVAAARESGKRRFWRAADDARESAERAENGFEETVEHLEDEVHAEHPSEEHRSKAGLFWGGAGLGLALYALLDAERREKVVQLANEASVQIQELVRDLQGYDDEF